MVKRALVIASLLAACQGRGDEPTTSSGGSNAQRRDGGGFGKLDPPDAGDEEGSAAPKPDEPEPAADQGKAIADLGAIAAWQAVVDRGQYLARRSQHGVVFGTIGAPILVLGPLPEPQPDAGVAAKLDAGLVASDYVWLVDDTEGNGALAIRVMLGKRGDSVKQGDRVALGGAWVLDDARRWYWKVDQVTPLPAAPPSDLKDPPSSPGHEIVNGNLAQGARTITVGRDNDAVYFMVTGQPPAIDGEGWPVADELGDQVYALLNLPGERPSFGGQDFRTREERWQLKRGHTYWVRIGKIRRHGPDKPVTMNARTVPVRVN